MTLVGRLRSQSKLVALVSGWVVCSWLVAGCRDAVRGAGLAEAGRDGPDEDAVDSEVAADGGLDRSEVGSDDASRDGQHGDVSTPDVTGDGGSSGAGPDAPDASKATVTAISVGSLHSCALMSDGDIRCWGDNSFGALGPGGVVHPRSPAQRVTAGNMETCAVLSGGSLQCWGDNRNGKLGNNSTVASPEPVDVFGLDVGVVNVAIGMNHACAMKESGTVLCWGNNDVGQLGNDTTTPSHVPVGVAGSESSAKDISAGGLVTCLLTGEGKAKCWGDYVSGGFGGSKIPADVEGLAGGVESVSVGGSHVCFVLDGGGVKCRGNNGWGQLGNGGNPSDSEPVDVVGLASGVAMVSAGWGHTCALGENGSVRCWGRNAYGQVGDGSLTDQLTPVDVVGLDAGVVSIGAGVEHSCVLMVDGKVRCWGDNRLGQLGNNSKEDSPIPVDVVGL